LKTGSRVSWWKKSKAGRSFFEGDGKKKRRKSLFSVVKSIGYQRKRKRIIRSQGYSFGDYNGNVQTKGSSKKGPPKKNYKFKSNGPV